MADIGRQVRSFAADLMVEGLDEQPVRVQGRVVAAQEEGVLDTAFHPELTDDTRLHELFIRMIRRRQGEAGAAACAAGEPGLTATVCGR